MKKFDNIGKLVILGSCTVGKTAVLQRYLSGGLNYPLKYNMTIGVVPYIKEVLIKDLEVTVKILFYDNSGLDVYTPEITKFWKTPDMLLIVYDVTSLLSFNDVEQWIELTKNVQWNNNVDYPIACAVFANKTDLIERRVISSNRGQELADKYCMKYFEGSAKTNENLNELFQWYTKKWYDSCTQNVKS